MFQHILKWTFKVMVNGVEKELNIHLDNDITLDAVEQVAMQMIAHCAKIKEQQAAQAAQKADAQAEAPAEPDIKAAAE